MILAMTLAVFGSTSGSGWLQVFGLLSGLVLLLYAAASLWDRPQELLHAALVGLPGGILLGVVLKNIFGWSPQVDCSHVFLLIDASAITLIALAVRVHFTSGSAQSPTARTSHVGWLLFLATFLFMGAYVSSSWMVVSNPRGLPFYSARIAGMLPFSDAGAWYVGSLQVQAGEQATWVARRPVHALLRAGELLVSGNHYKLSLLFQAFMLASAIGILGTVVARTFSFAAGVVTTVLLVNYSFESVGLFLSGSAGLTAACLGLGLMIEGLKMSSFSWRMVATFAIGTAWLLRPGPFGILAIPPVLEWVTRGKFRFFRGCAALAVLFGAYLLGQGAFDLVGAEGSVPNQNAAITLYGLSQNMNWAEATNKFFGDDPLRRDLSQRQQSELQKQLALESGVASPGLLLWGLLNNFVWGVGVMLNMPATALVSSPLVWKGMFLGGVFKSALALCAVACVMICSLTCLLVVTVRMAADRWRINWILFGGLIAFCVSAPLIGRDGGLRGMTILIPLYCLYLASILRNRSVSDSSSEAASSSTAGRFYSVFATTILALLVSFALVGVFASTIRAKQIENDPIVVNTDRDPCVFVTESELQLSLLGAPQVPRNRVLQALAGADGLDLAVGRFRPPFLLTVCDVFEQASPLIIPGATAGDRFIRVHSFSPVGDSRLVYVVDSWDDMNALDSEAAQAPLDLQAP